MSEHGGSARNTARCGLSSTVTRVDNLFDYFHDRVEEARSDAGVQLSDDSGLYLSQLLTERARTDRSAPRAHTLVELHARALDARPSEQARTWRELGDRALYELGYFRERLDRRLVGPDYYEGMGRAAYRRVDHVLKHWFADAFGELFRELSEQFDACVGVLAKVRRGHDATDNIADLYAEWLATGEEDLARQLRRMGLVIPKGPDTTS